MCNESSTPVQFSLNCTGVCLCLPHSTIVSIRPLFLTAAPKASSNTPVSPAASITARAPTIFPAVSGDTPLLIRLMYWVAADEPMSTTPDRPPAAGMEP